MNRYLNIVWLFYLPLQLMAATGQTIKSIGSLTFQCNGQLYTADAAHARAYVIKQTAMAYINAANNENMVINIEWQNVNTPGTFYISNKTGKAEFIINHKTYSLKQQDDYLKIVISYIKQQDSFLLLSGTFEGRLLDKNGNKVRITEGRFETITL
ncbi:MAG: hypothetical protein ABI675_24430 [Chitinophagaceae bacterium]